MSGTDPGAAALPWPLTLARPVEVVGQPTSAIVLREPIGGDIAEAGYPVSFLPGGEIKIDGRVMVRMIARLAGWPETAVRAMTAGDVNACIEHVTDFFMRGASPASS